MITHILVVLLLLTNGDIVLAQDTRNPTGYSSAAHCETAREAVLLRAVVQYDGWIEEVRVAHCERVGSGA